MFQRAVQRARNDAAAGDVGWQSLGYDEREMIVERLVNDMLEKFDRNKDTPDMKWWTPFENDLAVCEAETSTRDICRAVFSRLWQQIRTHWEQTVPDSYATSPYKFVAVIELVRKRDGIDLTKSSMPLFQRVAVLMHARNWAHRHWQPGRVGFQSHGEIRDAISEWTDGTAEQREQIIQTYGWIEAWDTSLVTHMSAIFSSKSKFNEPIGAWDVSNVRDMASMFYEAKRFNCPIGAWDTSSVDNMANMFGGANEFNQPIGAWNVSNVTDMTSMFTDAWMFNQPIGGWNTGRVQTMPQMFLSTFSFNQPIGDWDTSKVTDMSLMFERTFNFNQPLHRWDTAKVQTMRRMFCHARAFDQDISHFDVSSVRKVHEMFRYAVSFSQDHAMSWLHKMFTNCKTTNDDKATMFRDARNVIVPLNNPSFRPDESMCTIMAHLGCRRSIVDEVFRAHARRPSSSPTR